MTTDDLIFQHLRKSFLLLLSFQLSQKCVIIKSVKLYLQFHSPFLHLCKDLHSHKKSFTWPYQSFHYILQTLKCKTKREYINQYGSTNIVILMYRIHEYSEYVFLVSGKAFFD